MRAPAPEAVEASRRSCSCSCGARPISRSRRTERGSRTSSRPSFREKGEPFESRLWIDDAAATEPGAADALPRFSPDGSARLRLRPRARRPHEPLDPRPRRARRDPGLGRGHPLGARRHARCSSSPPISAPTAPARRRRRRSRRPARTRRTRRSSGPRSTGAASTSSTPSRATTREVQPDGVNVFEFGWARRQGRGRLHRRAIGERVVRRVDRAASTSSRAPSSACTTPEWQLQCPRISPGGRVAWIEGFASDRGVVTGTVQRARRRPARARARRDVDRLRRRGDALVRGLARRRLACTGGWRSTGSYDERLAGDVRPGRALPAARLAVRRTARASPRSSSRPLAPPEIARLDDGAEPRALTSLNERARAGAPGVAEWRAYTWESFDGLEIEGLLALPRGHENGALPLVVFVHGGPTATWAWSFPHAADCSCCSRRGLRGPPAEPARLERPRPGVRAREPRRHGRRRPAGHPRRRRRARRATASSTTSASRSPAAATAASCRPGRSRRRIASPRRSRSRSSPTGRASTTRRTSATSTRSSCRASRRPERPVPEVVAGLPRAQRARRRR